MLLDMLRQFAITAAVLVVVIAFGAAIKPMSNDSLISPLDAARFIGFAMVPMLQFAIPFAAAFAVTLTFHRLSQDNEIIAMAVAGQSYVRILAPFAAMGLSLTILLGVLTQSVIPSFIGKMTDSITSDIPRMLTRSIQQNSPFVHEDMVIWAENVFLEGEDGSRIVLDKAAVAKVDKSNRPKMYLTSSATSINIEKEKTDTSLLVESKNTVQWIDDGEGAGSTRGALESKLTHAIGISSQSQRRPSAMTRSELIEASKNPCSYPRVEKATYLLRDLLKLHEYWKSLSTKLKTDGSLKLISSINNQQFVVRAKSFSRGRFNRPIEVELRRRSGEISLLAPRTALLQAEQDEIGVIKSLSLIMTDVLVGVGEIGENRRTNLVVHALTIDGKISTQPMPEDISELLNLADEMKVGSVKNAASKVRFAIDRMNRQVVSRIGQRWAMSVTAFLIVLLGSLTAIRLRDRSPLIAFTWVFFPAVVEVILVFTGGQIVRDGRVVFGFSVMWIGNIGVAAMILYSWYRLRRN